MKKRNSHFTYQQEAPLYNAAVGYLEKDCISFHVPLHGRGSGNPELKKRGFAPLMRWDLTELDPLDDLYLPRGAIKKAQELAARLFLAGKSFFLVNGVTAGLLAALLSCCRPGQKVLLTRISHKAALHGIALAGAMPVYLPVEREPASGFPLNVSPSTVEQALKKHPDAGLLLVTSPSYWGVTADLNEIKKITSRYGVLLLVDEAHGTHLPFYGGKLPHSAAAGADIWLHSAHKSLGALTPGAFLHVAAGIPAGNLRFWLQALQTSSPSYPVMISLDLARRRVALQGKRIFSRCWRWAARLRRELAGAGFELLSDRMVKEARFNLDPCRITILRPGGDGRLLAGRLARERRLQVEMAAGTYILAIAGPAHLSLSPSHLAAAVKKEASAETFCGASPGSCSDDFPPSFFAGEESTLYSRFAMTPAEALRSPAFSISLHRAPGKVCAEMITLSPPGIPLVSAGEIITPQLLGFLSQKRAQGTLFQGAADPGMRNIKIV